jgi:hypothetical protein
MNIVFPALLYYDGKLTAQKADSFKAVGARFTEDGTFVHMEYRENESSGWLLGSDGKFHHLKPCGKKLAGLRPLRFLWNFVKSEFSVETKQTITAGEFLEVVSKSKKNTLAKDLVKFLSNIESGSIVNKELLNKWPL